MKLRKTYLSLFECEHKVFLVMFAFYFVGLIYGLFFTALNGGQAINELSSESFFGLLFKNSLLLFLIYIFGYTPFGAPIILFINCYSGICSGILAANIIISLEFKGALLLSFVFYLYFLLNIISLTFTSFSSLRLSFVVFNIFRDSNRYISAKVYAGPHLLKFSFFIFTTIISTAYYIYLALPITFYFI